MTLTTATEAPRRFKVRGKDGKLIGQGAELRRVPVAAIRMDSGYQRDLDMRWVSKHLPWDANKAQTLILSDRTGGPYCLDGQHRLQLARESGIHEVAAFVIAGLTKEQEADLFVSYQQERRGLKSWDLFKAELAAGRPDALEIVRITSRAGFRVAPTAGDDHIAAVESLKRTYKLGGERLLARVLGVLRTRWFGEAKSTSGQIIYGLALFFHACAGQAQYDESRFERVVNDMSPSRILREAQAVAEKRSSTASSSSNVAEALYNLYNDKLRPERRLAKLTIGGKKRPKAYGQ